jgi:hypothetical protein
VGGSTSVFVVRRGQILFSIVTKIGLKDIGLGAIFVYSIGQPVGILWAVEERLEFYPSVNGWA